MNLSKGKSLLGKYAAMFAMTLCCIGYSGNDAYALSNTITKGIKIGDIDVGGLTEEEAKAKIDEYISGFAAKNVTLKVADTEEKISVGELGYFWKNTNIITEADEKCKAGNVISRYKESKEIEVEGLKYDIETDVNDEILQAAVDGVCSKYNVPAVNAKLTKVDTGFEVSPEVVGKKVDIENTVNNLRKKLCDNWDGNDILQEVIIKEDLPKATAAECLKITDRIGTFTTYFSTGSSNYNRNCNMENGIRLMNGVTLAVGETFSCNALLEPWTEDNGWKNAGTYVNGRVEDSLGGGICQVSSTLYNAVLDAELQVDERYPHSMTVGYVPLSQDAALAGTWKDLKFTNDTDTPIYIEGIYGNGSLTFNIYGVETRPGNRTIEYISERTGYTSNGCTAHLLKRVYVDGNLESEEVVNKSTYSNHGGGTTPVQPPTEAPSEVPTEQPTEVPPEQSTELPPEETTEQPETEKDTEKETEPETEKKTEKKTEKEPEPVTEPETEKKTEPVTEKETEKKTEKVTEPETEKDVEPEKPEEEDNKKQDKGEAGENNGEE